MPMTRIAVIGGGAAGLAAALRAAEAGAETILLERNAQCGVKLLATGGGHCNVGNCRPEREWPALFGRRGRFILPALARLPRAGLCAWLAGLGVPVAAPDGFHLFPESRSAKAVRDALLTAAQRADVAIHYGARAETLLSDNGRIRGVRVNGEDLAADRIIVACGGKSLPASGSTWDGCRMAETFGHRIAPPFPGLVGLRIANLAPELAGIILPDALVSLKIKGRPEERGRRELLLTHHGISGPAALDLSASAVEAAEKTTGQTGASHALLRLRWLADMDREQWLQTLGRWRNERGGTLLPNLLREHLPDRLARWLCRYAGVGEGTTPATLAAAERDRLTAALAEFPAEATGSEGWDKAMITRGGVDVRDVCAETLESRLVKGLFFAGETLDMDGPCGGYNLHWAFASGMLAAEGALRVPGDL